MDDIASRCRHLAGFHAGTDLLERLGHALASQAQQRAALVEAADEIERLRAELQERPSSLLGSTAQAAMRALTRATRR